MTEIKAGFLTKVDMAIQAAKSAFYANVPPLSSQLNDGTHTMNYETVRFGWMGAIGLGTSYFTARDNFKWYYENCSFLGDCINLYADIASQVQIQEIDANGNIVENSEWVKLLDEPNPWQDGIAFIKEYVINVLTSGVSVFYGDFFRNGSLRLNANLYNLDFYNLAIPKIKDRYGIRKRDIDELPFKEFLENGRTRDLKYFELAFVYDQISRGTFGDGKGYNSEKFLAPISRITGIQKDLHVIMNSTDNMAFLSNKRANFLLSPDLPAGTLPPLQDDQKQSIETKLSGRRENDVVATNEPLKVLNLQREVKKMQLVEMQNNAKENIRARYGIPRDLLDAYNGTNSGSTYENQQFAEARFTLTNVKNITDSKLYAIERKNPQHFKAKGHKLIGKYEHMASVQAVNTKLKNEGFSAKADALMKFLNACEKSKGINGLDLNYEDFLRNYGFEEFLKYQSTQ